MNEILEKVIFDNTVRHWSIILLLIFLVALLRTWLSKVLARFIHKVVRATWSKSEREMFIESVMRPLGNFIFVLVSVTLLHDLLFPEAFKFSVYGHKTENFFPKLGVLLVIVYFIWFLVSLVNYIATILENDAIEGDRKGQDQLIMFLRDLLKVFVIVCGVLMVLQMVFNKDVRAILQGLTIVGAAVALAAKESLENLIASFIIFFDKPFYTGDTVKVNAVTGKVERIGLRSTRIRTADKTLITIPNKQMVDSVVDNWSLRTQRRAEMKLELSDKTSSVQIEKFIASIKAYFASMQDGVSKYSVFFTDYNKGGATVIAEYFTTPISIDEFNGIKQKVNLAVMKLVEEMDLAMSSNASTVNIFTNENDARGGEGKEII